MSNLPVISLESPTLAVDLYSACKDVGFFYLTDHGIPQPFLDSVIAQSRQFFLEASAEDKSRIRRLGVDDGGDGARGYQVVGENVTKGARDWHEGVDFYKEWGADTETSGLLRGSNLWPSHPPELKSTLEAYIEKCQEVGTRLVRAMGEALGEGDVFVNATRNSFWVMRMIGYPPLADDAEKTGGVSCGEHTDYGCVTLLLADSTPDALQVQSHDGTSWVSANPIPGAFVVNIGDMIERWTNGEWKSTNHRVIHRANNYRVSVPFFFEPDFDAVVEPLPKCLERTGGKAKYEKVVYGEHLVGKASSNFYAGDSSDDSQSQR
jgi:isopenicillin N synthase-like dioxygenase